MTINAALNNLNPWQKEYSSLMTTKTYLNS